MGGLKVIPDGYDHTEYLDSEEAIEEFLAVARQEGELSVALAQLIAEQARKWWGLPAPGA